MKTTIIFFSSLFWQFFFPKHVAIFIAKLFAYYSSFLRGEKLLYPYPRKIYLRVKYIFLLFKKNNNNVFFMRKIESLYKKLDCFVHNSTEKGKKKKIRIIKYYSKIPSFMSFARPP